MLGRAIGQKGPEMRLPPLRDRKGLIDLMATTLVALLRILAALID